MSKSDNNLPETNRRFDSPLSAGSDFGRAVHAKGRVLGGGRSANRSA
jgi:hypothetical protein